MARACSEGPQSALCCRQCSLQHLTLWLEAAVGCEHIKHKSTFSFQLPARKFADLLRPPI